MELQERVWKMMKGKLISKKKKKRRKRNRKTGRRRQVAPGQ